MLSLSPSILPEVPITAASSYERIVGIESRTPSAPAEGPINANFDRMGPWPSELLIASCDGDVTKLLAVRCEFTASGEMVNIGEPRLLVPLKEHPDIVQASMSEVGPRGETIISFTTRTARNPPVVNNNSHFGPSGSGSVGGGGLSTSLGREPSITGQLSMPHSPQYSTSYDHKVWLHVLDTNEFQEATVREGPPPGAMPSTSRAELQCQVGYMLRRKHAKDNTFWIRVCDNCISGIQVKEIIYTPGTATRKARLDVRSVMEWDLAQMQLFHHWDPFKQRLVYLIDRPPDDIRVIRFFGHPEERRCEFNFIGKMKRQLFPGRPRPTPWCTATSSNNASYHMTILPIRYECDEFDYAMCRQSLPISGSSGGAGGATTTSGQYEHGGGSASTTNRIWCEITLLRNMYDRVELDIELDRWMPTQHCRVVFLFVQGMIAIYLPGVFVHYVDVHHKDCEPRYLFGVSLRSDTDAPAYHGGGSPLLGVGVGGSGGGAHGGGGGVGSRDSGPAILSATGAVGASSSSPVNHTQSTSSASSGNFQQQNSLLHHNPNHPNGSSVHNHHHQSGGRAGSSFAYLNASYRDRELVVLPIPSGNWVCNPDTTKVRHVSLTKDALWDYITDRLGRIEQYPALQPSPTLPMTSFAGSGLQQQQLRQESTGSPPTIGNGSGGVCGARQVVDISHCAARDALAIHHALHAVTTHFHLDQSTNSNSRTSISVPSTTAGGKSTSTQPSTHFTTTKTTTPTQTINASSPPPSSSLGGGGGPLSSFSIEPYFANKILDVLLLCWRKVRPAFFTQLLLGEAYRATRTAAKGKGNPYYLCLGMGDERHLDQLTDDIRHFERERSANVGGGAAGGGGGGSSRTRLNQTTTIPTSPNSPRSTQAGGLMHPTHTTSTSSVFLPPPNGYVDDACAHTAGRGGFVTATPNRFPDDQKWKDCASNSDAEWFITRGIKQNLTLLGLFRGKNRFVLIKRVTIADGRNAAAMIASSSFDSKPPVGGGGSSSGKPPTTPISPSSTKSASSPTILAVSLYETLATKLVKVGAPQEEAAQIARFYDEAFTRVIEDTINVISKPRGEVPPHVQFFLLNQLVLALHIVGQRVSSELCGRFARLASQTLTPVMFLSGMKSVLYTPALLQVLSCYPVHQVNINQMRQRYGAKVELREHDVASRIPPIPLSVSTPLLFELDCVRVCGGLSSRSVSYADFSSCGITRYGSTPNMLRHVESNASFASRHHYQVLFGTPQPVSPPTGASEGAQFSATPSIHDASDIAAASQRRAKSRYHAVPSGSQTVRFQPALPSLQTFQNWTLMNTICTSTETRDKKEFAMCSYEVGPSMQCSSRRLLPRNALAADPRLASFAAFHTWNGRRAPLNPPPPVRVNSIYASSMAHSSGSLLSSSSSHHHPGSPNREESFTMTETMRKELALEALRYSFHPFTAPNETAKKHS